MLSKLLMRQKFATPLLQKQLNMMGPKSLITMPQRGIKLHEYQAGKLLDSYRVAIPLGEVAFTPEEAESIA